MIYVDLHCRLGNQLFQIAAGASLAAANHTEMRCCVCAEEMVPGGKTLREYTKPYSETIFSTVEFVDEIPKGIKHLKWNQFEYKPFPQITEDTSISGAFQSYRYFDENVVKKLFQKPDYVNEYILSNYPNLGKDVTAVHIRRGDYLPIPHKFPVMSLSYFKNAIQQIGNGRFMIISDDIDWCKQNFIGPEYSFSNSRDALIDLFLIASCQNVIMSNSSFSWWGAFLNSNPDKIVIAPNRWFGWSKETRIHNTKDLLPETWIKQTNRMDLRLQIKAIQLTTKEALLAIRNQLFK